MVRTRAGATTTAPAAAPASTTAIPLRPELVGLIGVEGVGRLACCSAALRGELRDAKAWQQLASAREPRSQREMAIDAERDAAARVRAYELRRRLADVASGKVEPRPFQPDKLADFTYFVRFEEDGEVIWEGDLKGHLDTNGTFCFSLAEAWSAARDSWDGMVEFLEAPTASNFTTGAGANTYLGRLRITVIAMRNEDRAMVPVGNFVLNAHMTGGGAGEQMYVFETREPVMVLRNFVLKPVLWFYVRHDEDGGSVNWMELGLFQNPRAHRGFYHNFPCEQHQLEFVLSFLASSASAVRGALATIESWHDVAARKWEEIREETMAAIQRME